jgi:hypothetical protein
MRQAAPGRTPTALSARAAPVADSASPRQSQLVGLTREQLTAIARDAQRQRAGATRGEELAALVVELAQQRVVPAAERHGG